MSRPERSLKDKNRDNGAGRNPWPIDLDTRDPQAVAEFTLGLGYERDSVVTTLVKRCNLDLFTARRIVDDAAQKLGGS